MLEQLQHQIRCPGWENVVAEISQQHRPIQVIQLDLLKVRLPRHCGNLAMPASCHEAFRLHAFPSGRPTWLQVRPQRIV